jgi:hypothetical protein
VTVISISIVTVISMAVAVVVIVVVVNDGANEAAERCDFAEHDRVERGAAAVAGHRALHGILEVCGPVAWRNAGSAALRVPLRQPLEAVVGGGASGGGGGFSGAAATYFASVLILIFGFVFDFGFGFAFGSGTGSGSGSGFVVAEFGKARLTDVRSLPPQLDAQVDDELREQRAHEGEVTVRQKLPPEPHDGPR